MSVGFERPARERVLSWFKGNSDNRGIEVEARIKDVSQLGFETVLRSLTSNKSWSNKPKEQTTLDLIHASGVRETHDDAKNVSFMRKERHEHFNCECGSSGYEVRFAVASESEEKVGFQDTSEVSTWRYKQRTQFVHKGLFSFDLTKVKQGVTKILAQQAETQYEIEVEFCGQADPLAAKEQQKAAYLTDSMLMKVADLVRQLVAASSAAVRPPAKRPRVESGALQMGEAVSLAADTPVALAPAGQGTPVPFGGELPAELAATVPWLFSHMEDLGEGPQAHIMNLPCGVGERRYPLYYLCGNVPASTVTRVPPSGR